VCLLSEWKEDRWLQAVAAEMNQSETAFVVDHNADIFKLRWFTPKVEVDLCGHATLASAHVLWQQGIAGPDDEISFSTRSGVLKAIRRGGDIELDFPAEPEVPVEPPANLLSALGVTAKYVGKNRFAYLVEVESETIVRGMTPDFKLLASVPCRCVIVTCRSSDLNFDFVSRFFAPAAGIDEDPVTGSAHCCLGEFWKKRLDKDEFLAYQASARGGELRVRVKDDRAFLGGKAVTVARGELLVEENEP